MSDQAIVSLMRPFFSLPLIIAGALLAPALAEPFSKAPEPRYETRSEHDPDGIGVFYMGREIARVVGHQAVAWLERPEREEEERTDLLIAALKLKPGEVVADIGAGTGYMSSRMARIVGEKGRVYAVDIQQEMLDVMMRKLGLMKIANVTPVLGAVTDPRLPAAAVDTILMVDVYHEFNHPYEMTVNMLKALKPGGRIVFVEFRGEDETVPIKKVHRMSEPQVKKEMAIHPLKWIETLTLLPRQHIIIFRKPA